MANPHHLRLPLATNGQSSSPCHAHNHSQATSSTAVDEHHRCASHLQGCSYQEHGESLGHGVGEYDIEQGPAHFERIVLLIDGLQCGCCEGGIDRVLSRMPEVRNHQVNVVLARLEFELDTARLTVRTVIDKLSAKTGFKFEHLHTPTGQVLDLLVADRVNLEFMTRPYGVAQVEADLEKSWCCSRRRNNAEDLNWSEDENFTFCFPRQSLQRVARKSTTAKFIGRGNTKLGKHLVRVHYDANEIGARDIFDYYLQCDHDLRLAPPTKHPSLAMEAKQTRRALLYFLPALLCTIPVVVFAWAPLDHNNLVYHHASVPLATAVQCIAIKEFLPGPLRSLWHLGIFEMDLLIAMSSTIAYAYSIVSYAFKIKKRPLETGSFFETSTLLVTLILLGRLVNEFARYRAAKSVSFRSLQADEALLVSFDATTVADPFTRSIDARLLQHGDCFKVPPHGKVVTDGVVLSGGSEVDESMITGESIPVAKGVHSTVVAGTTNGDGALIVKLTALPHENTVHKIAAMVEDAEITKPKAQALADRFAALFVPIMASIGVVVFVAWLLVSRMEKKEAWNSAIVKSLTFAIATLVVSCPCAIGLAVPLVVLIAGGVAARFRIILREPQKLEVTRSVTDLVFDKTGTLTCGALTVVGEALQGTVEEQNRTKQIVLHLLRDIKHPVAAAVLLYLERDVRMNQKASNKQVEVSNITSIPGCGVEGTIKASNQIVRAGSPDWLNIELPPSTCTVLCVTIDGLVATFQLKDRPRHTAEMVIEKLHAQGITTHMISGDGQGAVDDTAHTLGIPKRYTKSRCTPEGKRTYIQDLQDSGKVVMFVGDGTNDAIALKQADIGVHINQGSSDVAKSAADVVLMTTRLHDILILLDISRAAYRRIVLNFSWSAFYNLSAILLAAGAFTKIMKEARIEPQWAGLGELVSVLPVVLIAFQMRWRDYGRKYRAIEYDYMRLEAKEEKGVLRTHGTNSSSMSDEKIGVRMCPSLGRKKT